MPQDAYAELDASRCARYFRAGLSPRGARSKCRRFISMRSRRKATPRLYLYLFVTASATAHDSHASNNADDIKILLAAMVAEGVHFVFTATAYFYYIARCSFSTTLFATLLAREHSRSAPGHRQRLYVPHLIDYMPNRDDERYEVLYACYYLML